MGITTVPDSSGSSGSTTQSVTSTDNSFSAISGGGWSSDTFTGTGEILAYEYVVVSCQTDEDGTLFFDFSIDGINYNTFPVAGFAMSSGIHEYHSAHKGAFRYFRVRFVGTGGRSYFRLSTQFTNTQVTLNSPLSQGVGNDQDASTVKAILHGENESNSGSFVQGKMTADGAIKTSIVSSLINFAHDYYIKVNASATTDRYDYYTGGSGGTKVADILITYEDSNKNEVISAERTLV